MDRPYPPAALLELSELSDFGIRLTPAPEVWEWLQAEILADTGSIHNEDHAHLLDAEIRVMWASSSFEKQGRTVLGQAEQVAFRAGGWQKARMEQQMRDWFGDVPAFIVPLRPLVGAPAPDTLPLDPSTRVLVLADTHGEYEIVVEFLRRQGVIDADLNWAFGEGQMVVTGDIFDRGAHQLEILWLFYKLQAEAQAAGGALHVLLGNHENIVLRNDLRYLHPRYVETARILGVVTYPDLFAPETLLGGWLRSRPAVLKLGDLLLLHGGISPQVLDANLTISDLNRLVLASLETPVARRSELDPQTALVAGSFGPLWFRGYFPEQATLERPYMPTAEVERSLTQFGVERILVGHTVMDQVTPLYDGRVIAVQVYPDRDDETGQPILEGALRDQGRWFRVNAQGERMRLDGPVDD